MPYRIKRRTARITFTGTDYDGAEMRCRFDVQMDVFLAYQKAVSSTDLEDLAAVFRQFGDEILIEWDLEEEDGTPIPANGAGMMQLPIAFAGAILSRWLEEMATPSVPLAVPSQDGSTSVEESTPMDNASESPSS